jgi:dTDP-4-amino-4,6-dideoxygalactose transaminase
LKNFGFVDDVTVVASGINGKMSEFNAALGLLQLKKIDRDLERRACIANKYRDLLKNVSGILCADEIPLTVHNNSYFPILVKPEFTMSRDQLFEKLRAHQVYARRYFYPLITDFPMYRDLPSAAYANVAVAREVASQIMCLPIFPDLSLEQVKFITQLII